MSHDPTDDATYDAANRLGAGLAELVATPPPADRIDTAWAVRRGRSRLRRRRLALVGAVTAVAVGASVVAFALPSGERAGDTVTAAAGPATVLAGTPVLGPDTGRDPLTVDASFGWLPEVFDGVVYRVGSSGDPTSRSVVATGPEPAGATFPARATIQVQAYPAGVVPAVDDRQRATAPPVNGRPAYWLVTTDETERVLRWQSADGRWAEVRSKYLTGEDVAEQLHRVAESAVIGPQAMPLPFRMRSLSPEYQVMGVSFERFSAVPPATGRLVLPDAPSPTARTATLPWLVLLHLKRGEAGVTVAFDPNKPGTLPWGPLNSPPGAPARAQTCTVDQGLRVCAESFSGEEPFADIGGTRGILGNFSPIGPDMSAWTRDVMP